MKKIVRMLSFVLLLAIIVSTKTFIDGYEMYKTEINKISLSDKIQDYKKNKNYVRIDNIDEDFLKAIVSTEDRRFYDHGALDFKSIIRASVNNIKSGKIVQGGSTITQQLAKNMYFSNERKFSRKVAEVIVAIELEKNYSKDEILELYVNIINYGNGYTGIKQASEGYFNKEVDDLNFNEATMLAGLPQCPNGYNPKMYYEKAVNRQKQVILALNDNKKVTYLNEYYLAVE